MAERRSLVRRLGRTGREVSTLGLGGQAALMVPPEGADPVAIIEKAYRLGVSYFDTSNVYGPSQGFYGQAFEKLGLTPGSREYDEAAREGVFVASKTHMRMTRYPKGDGWPSDFSQGMTDGFEVKTAVDDVRRSLSQMFGDGKGAYPEGAYLDCIQIHNLTYQEEVDAVFLGLERPAEEAPRLGALAGLRDLKEGTNLSGANPKGERLVRHIGITGHWNSAALIYAIQSDTLGLIDTLLVAVNPTDLLYFNHRHNAIPVAHASGLGVIGMKVFTEGTYYGKPPEWLREAKDVYEGVGSERLPSRPLIEYALSIPGVDICLVGIGHIDEDPAKCQLCSNFEAAQIEEPLSEKQRGDIESMVARAGLDFANSYFQRPYAGLTAPRNAGAELDPTGFSPAIQDPLPAIRVSWNMAYAGRHPVEHYEVIRDGTRVATVAHEPQRHGRIVFRETLDKTEAMNPHVYVVRSRDTSGAFADSPRLVVPGVGERLGTASMRWRQSQYIVRSDVSQVEGIPGRMMGSGESRGLAFFENREVATLSILYTIDFQDGSGQHETHTALTFEDGSSFLIGGRGTTFAGHDRSSATFTGSFSFVGGTGRFEAIQGGGTYSGKRFAPLGAAAATYLDYVANYSTPRPV